MSARDIKLNQLYCYGLNLGFVIGLHFVMADFDEIYEEQEENEDHSEESFVPTVPDPVVVRGAGNMTV